MAMDLAPSSRPVAQILDDAVAGRRISAGDALRLLGEPEAAGEHGGHFGHGDHRGHGEVDLLDLGMAAQAVRNRWNDPEAATYNVDRNINYTNVCVYKCRFCAFYRVPGDAEGYLLPFEEIGAKVEETLALNGTGILMQGGVHPDLPITYYEDLLRYLRERYPALHIHAFSPPEIKFIARKERLSFYDVIARLKAAGLMSIPGGGAEILSDETRKRVLAYPKCSAEEWIDIMRQAHRNGLRTSATMMYGMGEDVAARVEHFQRIRDLQDETGGFTAFIPWYYVPYKTPLRGREATGLEYLRVLALSRLFLDNVPHLQASWLTPGLKLGQMALFYGCDDMGGTIIEEQVVHDAGSTNEATRAQVEGLVRGAGFNPVIRDTYWNLRSDLELATV